MAVLIDEVLHRRLHFAQGEVQQVEDDEGQDDEARGRHVASWSAGHHGLVHRVVHRACRAIHRHQAQRGEDVHHHDEHQTTAGDPLEGAEALQLVGVGVVGVLPSEHAEVTQHVDDEEQHHAQSGHGHDLLGADGGSRVLRKPAHRKTLSTRAFARVVAAG